MNDLRYAIRMLIKSPAFSVIAIVALALGIGANTAIFSVVDAVLLRPLPYPEPDKLILLREKMQIFDSGSVSYPNYLDWRAMQRSFTDLALYRPDSMNLSSRGEEIAAGTNRGRSHELEHDADRRAETDSRARLYRSGGRAGWAEGRADQRRALETAFWCFEESHSASS